MENIHHWDSGFEKSPLLSLLFSVSVLNAHGHIFSYRTYYAINSLAWEGEKDKSSEINPPCNLLWCSASTYCNYRQFMHWFMLSHPTYCSDPSTCWAISAQVINCFLLHSCFSCTVYACGFCSSATEYCGLIRLSDRHPQHWVTVAAKLDQTVQSTPIHHGFFPNLLKMCVAVSAVNQAWYTQASL